MKESTRLGIGLGAIFLYMQSFQRPKPQGLIEIPVGDLRFSGDLNHPGGGAEVFLGHGTLQYASTLGCPAEPTGAINKFTMCRSILTSGTANGLLTIRLYESTDAGLTWNTILTTQIPNTARERQQAITISTAQPGLYLLGIQASAAQVGPFSFVAW